MNDANAPRAAPTRGDDTPCELPAPPDAGRLYKPRHPLFGILFLYVVAEGLLWGAVTGAADPAPRLALAYAGLCVLLVVALRWIEGVELVHAPAKLGWVRVAGRWWGVAGLVAVPAALVVATRSADVGGAGRLGTSVIVLAGAALWQETFFRGFVFRSLMGRHGFVASALAASVLLALAVALEAWAGSPVQRGHAPVLALLEVPLGLGLCALFWMCGQSVWPAVVVRLALLGSLWFGDRVWPVGLAAGLLLLLGRFIFPRWHVGPPAIGLTTANPTSTVPVRRGAPASRSKAST